jgi:hypothetical protein
MPWDYIFIGANLWAILCWLVLAFAPKREALVPFIFYAGCGLLALSYTVLIIPLMAGFISFGNGVTGLDGSSLKGVMALLGSPGGATIGWIHYLTFDLFVGIWVARNADSYGYGRFIQLLFLYFVLMLGPLGLTLYLLVRFTCKTPPVDSVCPR